MVKVSVIVPVYNVEAYLDKCLHSLTHQTLDEMEIIIVNDGATDRSQDIIDRYKHDPKVKAFVKTNGGLSDARNYGMRYATGEYIGFVDSDDFVDLDMYEQMYLKAKSNDSDIVECNLRHTYPDSEDIEIGRHIYDKKEMLMVGRSVVWNKIYKRSWLMETGIQFPIGLIYEDVEFFVKLVPHIRTYSYIEPACVHYVQRGTSLNNRFTLKTLDILQVLANIKQYYEENGYLHEYREALEFLFARIILCSSFFRMSKIQAPPDRKKALEASWEFLNHHFPTWRRNPYLLKHSSRQGFYMRTVSRKTYPLYSVLFPLAFAIREKLGR